MGGQASVGGSDGSGHGDDEIGDGAGVGIHESQTAVGDGGVGNQEGGLWNLSSVGKAAKEGTGEGVDPSSERTIPGVPHI